MKKCIRCDEFKPFSDLIPDKRAKDGRRRLCHACKAIDTKKYHEQANLRTKKVLSDKLIRSCGLTGYTGPRKREPNEATGPQINKMAGVYKPEQGYYRNDGHKNIESKGAKC